MSFHRGIIAIVIVVIFMLAATGVFLMQRVERSQATDMNGEAKQVMEADKNIPEAETVDTAEADKEREVVEQAKEAIALAEEAVEEAQEFLSKQKALEQKDMGTTIPEGNEIMGLGNNIRGVYVTGGIAAGQGSATRSLRDGIVSMIENTELNAVVIDVKESQGSYVPPSLINFVKDLKSRGIWTIARIVVFADSSQLTEHPEWYSRTASGDFWLDRGGRYWLDPASKGAQDYIIDFSKTVIDAGFDELQYDYIRFPSDGNLADLAYPVYDGTQEMSDVIGNFFARMSEELREYRGNIVLSVDLFGLVAVQKNLPDIGQRLSDAASAFDYISFMLYPSHFYGGFEIPQDLARGLPALSFSYNSPYPLQTVSAHPYEVVYRSLLSASDYIKKIGGPAPLLRKGAGLRPWLQDFSLRFDTNRGILYDAEKVRLQIKAAEDAGVSGWLLWNPKNVYTAEVLSE